MEWRHSVPRPCQPSTLAAAGRRGLWSVDTAQTTGSCSYRGHRPAGPPRGQWACPLAGAAYGGCPVGSGGGELDASAPDFAQVREEQQALRPRRRRRHRLQATVEQAISCPLSCKPKIHTSDKPEAHGTYGCKQKVIYFLGDEFRCQGRAHGTGIGRSGRGERKGRSRVAEYRRTSAAGTQGGAPPQARAAAPVASFWSGRYDGRRGDEARGRGSPLRTGERIW